MVGMGYRTIKTAIGAGLAIWIASLIDLEFATFAAIIVIMCIEKTKKRTLHTIKEKFFASLLSIILGMLFFELLGYNPIAFAGFILLFVPILLKARIQNGFITSMVVVLHIYTLQEASLETFLNELYIILIEWGLLSLLTALCQALKRILTRTCSKLEKNLASFFMN